MKLGVKVIHCSERDTQITDQPKQVDEFVNTWSIEGFREEGITTAEMGWGTHEKQLPPLAYEHADGPRNQICLARMGINTWVRLLGAALQIRGMVVRHGEAFTISDRLTVWEDGQAGLPAHGPLRLLPVRLRPSPRSTSCAATTTSLQPKLRIMSDEITSGADILGALLMGHAYNSWWTGSDPEHRGIAAAGAASERHDHAGGDLGGGGGDVDDRESRPRRLRARRSAARLRPGRSPSRTWASCISMPSDWTPLKHYVKLLRRLQRAATSTATIRGSSRISW